MTVPSPDRVPKHPRSHWFGLLVLLCGLLVGFSHAAIAPAHWPAAGLLGPEHQLVFVSKDLRLRLESTGQPAGKESDRDEAPDWPILISFFHDELPFPHVAGATDVRRYFPASHIAVSLPPVRAPPQI